jgi:hypothetical protein
MMKKTNKKYNYSKITDDCENIMTSEMRKNFENIMITINVIDK